MKRLREELEDEFFNSFKVFLWISQTFCAAPVNINMPSKLEDVKKIQRRVAFAAQTIAGLVILTIVCIASFELLVENKYSSGLSRILEVSEYILNVIILLVVVVGCQFRKKFYGIFFERLLNVDFELLKCGVQPIFFTTKVLWKISIFVFVIFFLSAVVVEFFSRKMQIQLFVFSIEAYILPNLVSAMFLIQYSLALHYINEKFKSINCELERLASSSTLSDDNFSAMITQEKHTVRVLEILRQQHAELSRLIELCNDLFGTVIVLTIAAAFVILSSQTYELYELTKVTDVFDIWMMLCLLLWILLYCAKVILILRPINDVSDERKRSGVLLSLIPSNQLFDPTTLLIQKIFSDQLLQDSETPQALGIIDLDLTLIGKLVSVITSYLVILIQLDSTLIEQTSNDK